MVGEPFWLSGAARFAAEVADDARIASASGRCGGAAACAGCSTGCCAVLGAVLGAGADDCAGAGCDRCGAAPGDGAAWPPVGPPSAGWPSVPGGSDEPPFASVPAGGGPGGPEFCEVELWFAPTATTETMFVSVTTSSPGLLTRMMITTFDCCGCTAVATALAT